MRSSSITVTSDKQNHARFLYRIGAEELNCISTMEDREVENSVQSTTVPDLYIETAHASGGRRKAAGGGRGEKVGIPPIEDHNQRNSMLMLIENNFQFKQLKMFR